MLPRQIHSSFTNRHHVVSCDTTTTDGPRFTRGWRRLYRHSMSLGNNTQSRRSGLKRSRRNPVGRFSRLSREVGPRQTVYESRDRSAAVTNRELLVPFEFGERAAQRRVIEKRIIAKSARSSGFFEDAAINDTPNCSQDPPGFCQRNDTHKSGCAILDATHALEQELVIDFFVGVQP